MQTQPPLKSRGFRSASDHYIPEVRRITTHGLTRWSRMARIFLRVFPNGKVKAGNIDKILSVVGQKTVAVHSP